MNIQTTQPTQTDRSILIGGGGHGTRREVGTHIEIGRDSQRSLRLTYADPVPGKAREMADLARKAGIEALFDEQPVQALQRQHPDAFVVNHIDRLEDMAESSDIAAENHQPFLAYGFIGSPDGDLRAFRVHATADDERTKREASSFFRTLADITAPSRSAHLLGEFARPENRLLESPTRAWFASHVRDGFNRFMGGLPLKGYPMEITRNGGRTTQPMIVVDVADNIVQPEEIVRHTFATLETPVPPGEDIVIAELRPGAIVFHTGRIRLTDRKIAHRGSEIFAVKESQEFNKQNPLYHTD